MQAGAIDVGKSAVTRALRSFVYLRNEVGRGFLVPVNSEVENDTKFHLFNFLAKIFASMHTVTFFFKMLFVQHLDMKNGR